MRSRTFSDEGWVGDAGATRGAMHHMRQFAMEEPPAGVVRPTLRLRVAVLRCPRPIGRRPVRMQQLRCSSWLGLLHQLASEHAPPLLLGVVLCRPPATAPDGALVLIGARGGGTWHHHPPRHPRRKSLFWQTAACMIRYGRWPGPSVPPPGCPVCPGPLMDKYQRFFFCPTSRAPPTCACMPWEQFHSSIGHPRLSDASTCIVVLSTTTTGLLKRNFLSVSAPSHCTRLFFFIESQDTLQPNLDTKVFLRDWRGRKSPVNQILSQYILIHFNFTHY